MRAKNIGFVALLGAASSIVAPATARAADPVPVPISPVACLRKMALDLTNHGPSAQEIADLKSGAATLDALADRYVSSPEFGDVVFGLFRGWFAPTPKVPASADIEEPARIARYVVEKDHDFRELVTAGYTVDAKGAEANRGADAAGVLSTQNYLSAYSGIQNRNWAGRLLRGMTGVVLMQVTVVPIGTDSSREGLASNPACAGCHAHPIYGVDHVAPFRDCYDASGLAIPGCTQQRDLSFLGATGRTLPDLGKILAGSVEWRARMIQGLYLLLTGRMIGNNEIPEYRASETAWITSGYKTKALVKQIVTSSHYCSR